MDKIIRDEEALVASLKGAIALYPNNEMLKRALQLVRLAFRFDELPLEHQEALAAELDEFLRTQ
jgi:hypothetical protein